MQETADIEAITAPGQQDGTLVVVDMQAFFVKDCENLQLVANVVSEVKEAMARGWAVICLETQPWRLGTTIDPVSDLLLNYSRARPKLKKDANGSAEVIAVCLEEGFSLANLRVVGVWVDACVEQTAVGLVEKLCDCRVHVVKRACSTNFDEKGAWEAFRKRKRLTVA